MPAHHPAIRVPNLPNGFYGWEQTLGASPFGIDHPQVAGNDYHYVSPVGMRDYTIRYSSEPTCKVANPYARFGTEFHNQPLAS